MMADMAASPVDLVRAARQGDTEAFCVLVEGCQDAVWRTVAATCDDFDLVDEAVQDAFVVAWERLSELREPAAFCAWVAGIARRQVLMRLRDRRRSPVHALDRLALERLEVRMEGVDDDLRFAEQQRLVRCVAALGPRARKLVAARYGQGRSLSALAQAFKKPRQALAREVQRLAAVLRDCVRRSEGVVP